MPRDIKKLQWNGFQGINTKADPTDIKDTQALQVKNLKISRKLGALWKCFGYRKARLNGTEFNRTGLGDKTINAIAELVVSLPDSNSPYYVCQAGNNNEFFRWTGSQWTAMSVDGTYTVDTDVVRFVQREQALLALTGSGESNMPVLIQFFPERFVNSYTNADKTSAKLAGTLGTKTAETPTPTAADYLSGTEINSGSPDSSYRLESGYYYRYKLAIEYDNRQWSKPSDDFIEVNVATGDGVRLDLQVAESSYNRRITAFRIFRSKSDASYIRASDRFRLLREARIDDDVSTYPSFINRRNPDVYVIYNSASKKFELNTQIIEYSNIYNNQILAVDNSIQDLQDVSSADALLHIKDTYGFTDDPGKTTNGAFEVYDGGGCQDGAGYYVAPCQGWYKTSGVYYWGFTDFHYSLADEAAEEMHDSLNYADVDANVNLNYELAEIVNKRVFVARYHDGDNQRKDLIRVSSISSSGTYQYDIFLPHEVINLSSEGLSSVIGLKRWMNKLLVFGNQDTWIVNFGSGQALNWKIRDTLTQVGLVAPDSLTQVEDAIYYISADGPRRFQNGMSQHLPHTQEQEDWPLGVSTLSDAIGVFDKRQKEWIVLFPSDGKVLCFDLVQQEWTEYDFPLTFTKAIKTNDDTLLLTDGTTIYEMTDDAETFDGTAITPTYYSKTIKFPNQLIRLLRYEIRYNSNTALSMKFYVDGSELELPDQQLSASESYVDRNLPVGTLANEINFEITLNSNQASNNSTFQIYSVSLLLEAVNRL